MKKEDIFTKLFQFSIPTFYNWQREKRPIIKLLEKYFTKDDLEEFLQTGKIQKFEENIFCETIEKEVINKCTGVLLRLFAPNVNISIDFEMFEDPANSLLAFLEKHENKIKSMLNEEIDFKENFLAFVFDQMIYSGDYDNNDRSEEQKSKDRQVTFFIIRTIEKLTPIEFRYFILFYSIDGYTYDKSNRKFFWERTTL